MDTYALQQLMNQLWELKSHIDSTIETTTQTVHGFVNTVKSVTAYYAEIEAMKAENVIRAQRGESPAYGEDCFFVLAEKIRKA